MTALPTNKGYRNVTPTELVTLVTSHAEDKISVSFQGINTETNKPYYIVMWKE